MKKPVISTYINNFGSAMLNSQAELDTQQRNRASVTKKYSENVWPRCPNGVATTQRIPELNAIINNFWA